MLKLSREQIAKQLGVLPATVAYYETKKCSKKYYEQLERFIKKHE